MLKRPVYTTGWRYKLAQQLLWLLFGKREMYISPWKHTAVGTAGLFFYQNKLLLGLRAAHTHRGGQYGLIGGYVDFERNESPTDALLREVREEAGLTLSPMPFSREALFDLTVKHNRRLEGEFDNFSRIDMMFIRHLTADEIPHLRDTDEMSGWAFYTLPEVQALAKEGKLAADIAIIERAFASLSGA
jgi:8-oxo-dGTP pyrophosphatase MutT (NUDIX family)